MKITIFELIGLVKDNKEPKRIKYKNRIYDFINDLQDYRKIIDEEDENELFVNLFYAHFAKDFLDDEVEIIEEPKKIEKLPYYSLEKIQKSKNKDEWYKNRLELLEKQINDYHNKINELIDEINNLKEND